MPLFNLHSPVINTERQDQDQVNKLKAGLYGDSPSSPQKFFNRAQRSEKKGGARNHLAPAVSLMCHQGALKHTHWTYYPALL